MTSRPMDMAGYVSDLVELTFNRLGLVITDKTEQAVAAPLRYENGAELMVVVQYRARQRWFRSDELKALVSIATPSHGTTPLRVHDQDTLQGPDGPDDVLFMARLSVKIRAMAWTLAVVCDVGECLSLPGRPDS